MKKILVLLVLVCLISFASAATNTVDIDDSIKINEEINYKKPCFNNGTFCSSETTCNFSVYEPDNSILIGNQQGDNNGAYHNITFTPVEIGLYHVDMTCNDSGSYGSETFYFYVSGSGIDNIWFYILFIVVGFGLIFLGFYVGDNWIIVLGGFIFIFFGIYILFYGLGGFKDTVYTWALGLIVLLLGAYFSLRGAWESLT